MTKKEINHLTIAGAGTLGSQIAFQAALNGVKVRIYNPHTDRAKKRLAKLAPMFQEALHLSDEQVAQAQANIVSITNDWETPFADADLVIEALSENLEVKHQFFDQLMDHVQDDTIIASNSSTMMPSQLAHFVKHPERFLHMHFANHVWRFNTLEIVGSEQTDPDVIATAVAFGHKIKMLTIQLKKENPGYIMNALSIPLLNAALLVWAKGVADPITIDKDWMNSTGMPMGPFMSLDMIGIRTAYAINSAQAQNSPEAKLIASRLKEMVDEGKTGELAGEGFYSYPHPAFEDPDFLKK